MLTEKEIQKYESLVHQYSRDGNDGIANDLAHVLQSLRELQAENARLREQLTMPPADETMASLIREKCSEGDPEEDHCNADAILCGLLEKLGYTETVKAYESIDKWYA